MRHAAGSLDDGIGMAQRGVVLSGFRDGVVSAFSPWVAAGQPAHCHPGAAHCAMAPYCLSGISRTGRFVPAHARHVRRDRCFIKLHHCERSALHYCYYPEPLKALACPGEVSDRGISNPFCPFKLPLDATPSLSSSLDAESLNS